MTEKPEQIQQPGFQKKSTPALAGSETTSSISNHLLRALDASKDTILLTDANAVILYANQTMLTQSGCNEEDLIGQKMTALWVQPNALTQKIMAELEKNNTWRGRIQYKSKGMGHFWESCTISPVIGVHGNIAHFIKTGQIVDDEAEGPETNKKIDSTYKSILSLMGDGYMETDLKGNITFLNDTVVRIYKRSQEELIGLNYKAIMTSHEAERIFQYFNEIYQTGRSGRIIDYEVIDSKGVPTSYETVITLLRDNQGNPVGFGGVIRDVTKKKKLARQLKESKESYHQIVELAPDAITISRVSDGHYLEVNEAFCQQTGYSSSQVIGRTAIELNIYADLEDRNKIVQALRNEGHISGLRVNFRHKDGSLLYGIVSSRIVQFKGEECILLICYIINPLVEAQEALKQSEKRNRVILEAVPDAISLTRLEDGRYIQNNKMFYTRTGYTPEETIGRTSLELEIYADKKDRDRFISALQANGQVDGMEILMRYKDGTLSYQLWSGRIIEWEGEPCLLVAAKTFDDQKKSQQLLQEREQSYYTILNTAPYGIVIARRADSTCAFVNDAYCERTGYTRAETIGRTTIDLNLYVDPTIRARMLERLERDGKVFGMEVKFRNKSGKTYESLISVSPIAHMGEECLLIITMDISERKEAQRQLEKSEQRFRTIFESARDGIFLKDKDLKYTLVNPAMERLCKINSTEFIGHTDEELFGEQGAVKVRAAEKQVLQGEIIEKEFKIQAKTIQTFHTIRIPLMGKNGEISGVCGFERDITSIKQLEAQLLQAQKMEAVGTLAGGISHDFNNLLQAIIGYSQMLLMDEDDTSINYPKLKAISDAAQRASELTAQLLTFSRKVEIHPRPINLNHIVLQVEKLLKRTIPKMIDIELQLTKPILTVNVDPGQVEQVLLNIGVNARDAMGDGGRLIFKTINVTGADAPHRRYLSNSISEYVMLSVIDNGQGMTEDILEHIFEPFYTTKELGKGTGLGLAMVYGIIQNHGGRIFCESRPGEGTSFHIYFPVVNLGVTKEAVEESIPIKQGHGETILFIDDEEPLRNIAREFLSDTGYTAITAESGESGLALYKEKMQSISAVILDLIMPGMGGRSCLKQILEINPKAKVIICSGHSPDNPDTDEILQKAICFLKKPYDFKKLLQLLSQNSSAN